MTSAGVCSWVTLATNDQYAAAALVLAHSLRSVSTSHRLTALITPSVSLSLRGAIGGVFDEVVCVDVLDSRDEANLALLRRPELGVTLTKLHAWRLTQYTKCVFLDADCLVMSNCDDLFERDELSAAPDIGWPDCFNSGVFVFTPSLDTFNALLRLAESTGSFDGGDQGLLNEFFNSWCTGPSERRLSFLYNMVVSVTYTCLPAFKRFGGDVKIVHFLGDQKPWRAPHAGVGDSPSDRFHQRWHQLYRDHVVPHLAHSQMRLQSGSTRSLTVPLSSAGQSTQIGVCSLDTDPPCLPVDTCPATSYEHLPAAAAATAAFSEITRSYEDGGDSLVDDRTDSFVWRDPGQCIDSSDQVGGCSWVSSIHRQVADQSTVVGGQHNTNHVLDRRCYDDRLPFNRPACYQHTLFGIQGVPGCVDGIISVRERGKLDEGLCDNVQTGSFCTSCGRSINTYINESSDELKSCWMAEDVVCDSPNKCPRAGMKTFSSDHQQSGTPQHSFNNDPVARCENIDMSQVSVQVCSKSNFRRRTAFPRRKRPFSRKCVMVTAGLRMVVKISRGAVVSAAVCVVREPGVKLRVVADGRPILVRLGVGGVPLSDRRVRNAFKRRGNAAARILISAKFISALLCGLRRQAFTESPSPHLAEISSPHGVTCSRQNSFSGPGVSANDSNRSRDDVHDRCCCSICCRLATNESTAGHEDRQHRELSFDNSCHSLDQKPSRSRALLATCKRRGCGAALEGDQRSETKVELLSPSLSQLTVSDDADQTRRRSAWEYGQPDYMGADKFDSILAKIDQTMSRTDSEQ